MWEKTLNSLTMSGLGGPRIIFPSKYQTCTLPLSSHSPHPPTLPSRLLLLASLSLTEGGWGAGVFGMSVPYVYIYMCILRFHIFILWTLTLPAGFVLQ